MCVHVTTCVLALLPLCREKRAVENLLTTMASAVQRNKRLLKLRSLCCEERVWKSHLNYSMAQAHMVLFHKELDQLHGGGLQHRFKHKIPAT